MAPESALKSRLASWRAKSPSVLPSLLLCDFGHLADEIAKLEHAGAQILHLDVMDGHFVPNLSYGLLMVETVRKCSKALLDVHLMIANPGDYLQRYAEAGADCLTFHVEATNEPGALIQQIHDLDLAAGLALNPPTPLQRIQPFVADCDQVLVMSVMPGFGGQKFDPVALSKLRELRVSVPAGTILAVDGGVNLGTVAECGAAGADWLVAGSAIFGQSDYRQAMDKMLSLARNAA